MKRLWAPHDPGGTALRRGIRVGLLTPAVLAIGLGPLDDPVAALFAAFAVVVLLGFVDFDGPPALRARAYAGTTLAGAVLIVAATPLSLTPAAAAAFAAVTVFAVRLAGGLGGRVEASGVALILAVVLAAVVPAPADEIGSRLIGWVGAGVLALVASVTILPRFSQRRFARAIAVAARTLAAAVRDPARSAEAVAALDRLRAEMVTMPFRPHGFWRRERSLRRAADGLFRLRLVLPLGTAAIPEDEVLLAATADALDGTAELLATGRGGADLPLLEDRRVEHIAASGDHAGRRLAAGEPPDTVLDALDGLFRTRVVAFEVESLAANALVWGSRPVPPADAFLVAPDLPSRSPGLQLRDAARILRGLVGRKSARTRSAARAGVGIGLAIAVASAADLDHGFWVVLATLLALRSNAASTARTAFEAVAGTVAGIAVATVLMVAVGDGTVGLWVALPFVAFAAGYAPDAIDFRVGQGAFAVLVVVLFNLIEPAGWQVGLVRIVDVAVGVGVALGVALLMWPRGAVEEVGRAAGEALLAGSAYIGAALGWLFGAAPRAALAPARSATSRSLSRCSDALAQHVGEPGTEISRRAMLALLDAPAYLRAAGDMLHVIGGGQGRGRREPPELAAAAAAALGGVEAVGHSLVATAEGGPSTDPESLRGIPGSAPPGTPSPDPARPAAVAALAEWGGRDDPDARTRALRIAYARETLRLIATVADAAAAAADDLCGVSRDRPARPAAGG